MGPLEIAGVCALVVVFAAFSMRIERWPITMPMVFVGAGALADVTGLVDIATERESIALLAEITLVVILFSDASRIEIRRLKRFVAIPSRLLLIGLPLTICLGTLVNSLLFPDLALAEVALIAAILAPTDAALGSAVIEDEAVPIRERLALDVESGVNDGMVVPVVAILTAVVIGEQRSTASWVGFVTGQIGGGVAAGLVVGGVAIALLRTAHRRGWTDARYEQLATFVVPVIALFGAEAVGGNSFIAAFVAGLTFGSWRNDGQALGVKPGSEQSEQSEPSLPVALGAFTEDAAQLLALAAFFVFGNVLVVGAFEHLTVAIAVCALATLTVGRMLPVWISLIGTSLRPVSRLFVGWFGPRGLASIVFGLVLLEDTEAMATTGETIFDVIALTVTASVVLHGATAAIGARRYGAWSQDNDTAMPDEHEAPTPKGRWARTR